MVKGIGEDEAKAKDWEEIKLVQGNIKRKRQYHLENVKRRETG